MTVVQVGCKDTVLSENFIDKVRSETKKLNASLVRWKACADSSRIHISTDPYMYLGLRAFLIRGLKKALLNLGYLKIQKMVHKIL